MFNKPKVLVLIMIAAFTLSGCGLFKTGISLENYITYNYEGVDGYGSITAKINTEGIREDYIEDISDKELESFNTFIDNMSIDISKRENLENGDTVIITAIYDKEAMDGAGVKLSKISQEITIEGLIEGELLDLFADIKVNVTGIAPLATATIENNSSNPYIQALGFSLDKEYGFMAGDILNVSCDINVEQAREDGYVVLETTHQYNTQGIKNYVMGVDNLDYDMLSQVAKEAAICVSDETKSSHTRMLYKVTGSSNYLFQYNKEWIESIEIYGGKLLTCSDLSYLNGDNKTAFNKIFLIFKAYVTNADHGSDGYFAFEYTNAVINTDGTVEFNHDNQELRYVCSDTYEGLMEKLTDVMPDFYNQVDLPIEQIVFDISEENVTSD